jgi:superfamily II DNA/RNA helicase
MADMGFLPAVRRILDRTSDDRQTLLFSATLDGDVAVLSRRYQQNPVRHDAPSVEPETSDARHHFWLVQHSERVRHAADVVDLAGRSIVFTRTRRGADRVAKQLSKLGVEAVAMHGGRTQGQRSRALRAFSDGRAHALVATDVAARGIHIDSVESVIHFDPPADHKDYLHRSGRTARAGQSGTVVSLVTGEQQRSVRRLQQDLNLDAPIARPQLADLRDGGHRMEPERRDERQNGRRHERATSKAPPPKQRRSSRPRADKAPRHHIDIDIDIDIDIGIESLYVSNLPWRATAKELEAMFGRYGKVHEITIITDKRSGRSKGFGFVDMPRKAAQSAVKGMNGRSMHGRDLTVKVARPRTY